MILLNPDVFIAKKNLVRYQVTGLLDANYLGSLSEDALPYTIQLLDDPKEDVRNSFAQGLYWMNYYCGARGSCAGVTEKNSWKSTRLNSAKAKELIISKQNILKEIIKTAESEEKISDIDQSFDAPHP